MIDVSLGAVTAYADAVAHGYTGSRDDFGCEQANFAQNAQSVEASKNAAETAAENALSYSSHPPKIDTDGNWELWNGTSYVSTSYPSRGEKGETGATGPKGDKGDTGENGITPHIGENGNWFIGDEDTGVNAGGASGTSDAVQYIPQELTETEQKQARENISAQAQVYAVSSGNPWSADDGINKPFKSVKLYGASEQKTYSGKNLFDINDTSKYTLGNATYNEGVVTSNINNNYFCHISISAEDFPIELGANVEFGFCVPENPTGREIAILVRGVKTTATYQEVSVVGNYVSIKVSPDFTEITSVELRFNRSRERITDTTTNFTKFQISEGVEESPSYEPYVGGIPSPSPDYPQEIRCNNLIYTLTNDSEYNYGSVTAPELCAIGDARDELDAVTGKGVRRIGKIESYNGESVDSEYISNTGDLSDGSKVIYVLPEPEEFTAEPTVLTMPNGYAEFVPAGDGVAGEIEAEYAVDIEKRYVPKTKYAELEARVQALEANAIGG